MTAQGLNKGDALQSFQTLEVSIFGFPSSILSFRSPDVAYQSGSFLTEAALPDNINIVDTDHLI